MDKQNDEQHNKGSAAAVELADAYYETQRGFIAAWNKAQEFYDANVDDNGTVNREASAYYHRLLERAEKYIQQLAHLDSTRKILKDMRALFPYSAYGDD